MALTQAAAVVRLSTDGERHLDATDQRQIGDNRDGKTPFAVVRGRRLAFAHIRRLLGPLESPPYR